MCTKNKIGIFSFFSGAGFLDLGFELSGFYDILFVNEFHKAFMDTYQYSRKKMEIPEPKFGYHLGDITEFLKKESTSILKTDIAQAKQQYKLVGFIGGPPCPDFSVGGKNKGRNGENGKLSDTYIKLIVRIKPDFFLFENVKGLYRTTKHREFFDELKKKLRHAGYYLTEKLINSLEYGAPQNRERIILIGFHKNILLQYKCNIKNDKNLPEFNWNTHIHFHIKDIQKAPWPEQDEFIENSKKENSLDTFKELTVEHWFRKNNVANHPNAKNYFQPKAGLIKFKSIPEGDDSKKSYKRLHRWRYSPTAAYGNNEVHLHPYKARRLSVAEALAIQSLPSNYEIPENISLSDMFKTVGNGVPFLAAKGLALTINNYIATIENNKQHETDCE